METVLRKKSKSSENYAAIAIFMILAIAIIYSTVIFYLKHEKFWDWLNTLAGTLISFFLAALGGIALFRFQTKTEDRKNLESLVSLLSAELSDLNRILGDSSFLEIEFPSKNLQRVLVATVQPLVTEKAAVSGLFKGNESEKLLHLARKVRMLNFKSNYFMGLLSSRSEESLLINAINNIEETRVAIINDIDQIVQQFGLKIS